MNTRMVALMGLSLLLWGCASTGGFPPQTALETAKVPSDKRIEISLEAGTFAVTEVEFHVDAASIPESVIAAAKKLIPGGYVGDCEIEYHGGSLYYEVTCTVQGVEMEVMFTPDGAPYRWEVEVDKDKVPAKAVDAAMAAVPGAVIKKAEEILDKDKNVLEYHFKLEKDWIKYKAAVSTSGELLGVYRETIGEIEGPLL